MPLNSARCLIRSTTRSPPSLPTAPTTRTGFTMLWPSTLRKLRLSSRRGRRPCSVHRPKPIRPSVTAISRSLPSRAGWADSEPRAIMRGPGRRVR
jgi:hypothetical protein